jgi:ABC-type multidrug transport system fused ATPase/permease subunit
MVVVMLEAVAGGLTPYALGRLIGALTGQAGPGAFTWLTVLFGLLVVSALLTLVDQWCADRGTSRLQIGFHQDLTDLASARLDLGRSQRREQIETLYADLTNWQVMDGLPNEMRVVYARCLGLVSFVMVATWNPWCALVVAGLHLAMGELMTGWQAIATKTTRDADVAGYWRELLAGTVARREVRLFGLGHEFIGRLTSSWDAFTTGASRAARRAARPLHVVTILLVAAYGGSLAWLTLDTLSGALAIGSVVTVVGALLNFSGFGTLGTADMSAALCQSIVKRLAELRALVLSEPGSDRPASGTAATVEAEAVTYTYPGSPTPVLNGLTLRLEPGTTTAIVGINGSGKSTFVRLLAGLYEPEAGQVGVDGLTAGRAQLVSAVFQEPAHFPLDVVSNIGLGRDGVEAAAQAAGVTPELLARRSEDGDNPGMSGGQWQRVALARCLLNARRRGGLVVLDEPTSALDPLQEKALFDDFRRLTHGLTTVLVTHRLGSVVDVDRIVVLDQGRVVEDGTHAELMAAGGEYAGLFELQRHALLDEDPTDVLVGGHDV